MPFQKIADEIIAMGKEDQTMRQDWYDGKIEWNLEIDQRLTARMKEIVDETGWPTISKVGEEASKFAWLLVQHADHDVGFQHKCLDLMKEVPDDVHLKDIAYLEDRVCVNEKRPQIYGTQFFGEGEAYGPRPIFEIEHIEERRAKMGMKSFKEYSDHMKEFYAGFKNKQSK